ncbi:MAG: hypothetical protein GOVbin2277_1 [Prokaryotic dsDNA virus sp.]|jgi:hypothetical protein|nr:MAG: hypothetical protein GOVbin2277_1 [Prokaryotic dsDNA virus sp.]
MTDLNTYIVTIQDEVKAESFKDALFATLQRFADEETVASVEWIKTGDIHHYEIRSGTRLD